MKIKTKRLSLLVPGVLLILFVSCNPSKKYEKEEQKQTQEYLASLGDTTYVTKPSGLIVIELVEGTGSLPVAFDTVSIRYRGSFLDGRVFATNAADPEPLTFIAGTGDLMDGYALIPGLSEGVLYIKVGGRSRLITPSSLAYGASGAGNGVIPGYTPLRWEIEVIGLIAGPR